MLFVASVKTFIMPPTPTTLVPLDMRRLAPGEQEAIRERVVRAVLQNGLTQTAAAALFGVSRASVNTWVGKVAVKGADALKSGRRGAKPGDRASRSRRWGTTCADGASPHRSPRCGHTSATPRP